MKTNTCFCFTDSVKAFLLSSAQSLSHGHVSVSPLSVGVLQVRILDWIAMSSSESLSNPTTDQVSCIAGGFVTV